MTVENNTELNRNNLNADDTEDIDWDIKEEELIKRGSKAKWFTNETIEKLEKCVTTETIEKIEKCSASITGSKLQWQLIRDKINRLTLGEVELLRLYLTYELLYGRINDPGCLRRGCVQSRYAALFAKKTRFNSAYYLHNQKKKLKKL